MAAPKPLTSSISPDPAVPAASTEDLAAAAGGAEVVVVMEGLAVAPENIVQPEAAGGVTVTAAEAVMVAEAAEAGSATIVAELGIWRGTVTRAEAGVGDLAAVVEAMVAVAVAVVVVVITVVRKGIWQGNALIMISSKNLGSAC